MRVLETERIEQVCKIVGSTDKTDRATFTDACMHTDRGRPPHLHLDLNEYTCASVGVCVCVSVCVC